MAPPNPALPMYGKPQPKCKVCGRTGISMICFTCSYWARQLLYEEDVQR